jgi:long-chain acyl-CoA synthetase
MDELQARAWDEDYLSLCDHAYRVAIRICVQGPIPPGTLDPGARYLLARSTRFSAAYSGGGRPRPSSAAADALDAVADAWPAIARGDLSGEMLFEHHPGLWQRLMNEWPMGHYADMVAQALAGLGRGLGNVVELGAGTGATTRRIRPIIERQGGHLTATDLGYGPARAVDFERRLLPQIGRADVVVATNALHCAQDPLMTLRWIRELVSPAGLVMLGEGAPDPEPGVPWALDLIFGACRGWHDRGGFRSPEFWLRATREAGFEDVRRIPWPSRRYELGGVLIGLSEI